MKHPATRLGAALATAALSVAALASSAAADVPSFDRCPRTSPNVLECIVLQSTSGSIAANGHSLPLGHAVKLEGGIAQDPNTGDITFVPPASGAALTAQPVDVPGGLFGTGLPYNLNSVKATLEQVGPVSYDYYSLDIAAPIRIKFTNPLLGANCAIGSAASPITLHLTTGTTSPPPPNAPVTGQIGAITNPPGVLFAFIGNVHVDNAFAVPAATGCGVAAQAQVTKIINKNLGLPSAAGRNAATLTDDLHDKVA